jgi:hypothetical protein
MMLVTVRSFFRRAPSFSSLAASLANRACHGAALAVLVCTMGSALAMEPYQNFIEDADWAKIAAEPNVAMVIVVRLDEDDPDKRFETFVPRKSESAWQFSTSGEYQEWLAGRSLAYESFPLAYHEGSKCVCKHLGTIVDVCK